MLRAVPGATVVAADHSGRVQALFDEAANITPIAGIRLTTGPNPQRLAPYAFTLLADVEGAVGDDIGSGRFVILHDPQGQPGWSGTWRVIVYARADVDEDMATDPLLSDVAWSWLTEAWQAWSISPSDTTGTVTCNQSRPYGDVGDRLPSADVELRCSWTPQIDANGLVNLNANVHAWLQMLAAATQGMRGH